MSSTTGSMPPAARGSRPRRPTQPCSSSSRRPRSSPGRLWPAAPRCLTLPAAAAASLGLSLVGVTSWPAFAAIAAALTLGCAALARSRSALGTLFVATLAFYYAGLLWGGEAVSLSLLGPNPDAGGRFYGLSNELETILAGTAIVGAALLWERFGIGALIAVGGLGIVTIAPGRLGASVTGAVVIVVGLSVLAIDLEGRRGLIVVAVTAAAGAAALLLAPPRHFSDASPDRLLDRLELSGRLAVDSVGAILLVFALSIPILAVIALRIRRSGPSSSPQTPRPCSRSSPRPSSRCS